MASNVKFCIYGLLDSMNEKQNNKPRFAVEKEDNCMKDFDTMRDYIKERMRVLNVVYADKDILFAAECQMIAYNTALAIFELAIQDDMSVQDVFGDLLYNYKRAILQGDFPSESVFGNLLSDFLF